MALTKVDNPIKELQTGIPRGAPFDIYTARSKGVSSALAWQYVHSGWLHRLERGVFMFPNDNLQRDPSLKFLAKRLPGFHVGGKTALAWRGIRHYLAPREHLILWGEEYGKLPEWFTSRFPSRYVAKRLFSKELPSGYACQPLPESPDGPMVSTPERALLEMLSEVGLQQGIEEARLIMESVHSLRPEVLEKLLKNCLRIKVQRLCVQWAQELNLDWSPVARAAVTLGKSYWCTRLKDGTTLTLKP